MNFLCPACRTPLPQGAPGAVVPCTCCGVQVDLTRLDTSPGTARLWPDVDLAGEALGEFRLQRRLASGGMGIVYEAEGPQGRCAVKVLSALLAADPALRKRFAREAAALREIQHEGVVRVFTEGEDRGFCWFAMERVDGPDLRSRLAQGPLSASEVLALARALLTTLEAVHRKGFVHRDLKPGNILLAASGPKLCDFGIARCDGSSTLTESAAVLGSLRYMAPEQRQGRTSPQSDLYSLGVVLHEALAGSAPGEAELPRAAPRRLRRLIAALLSERPAGRPADAVAARALLEHSRGRGAAVGAVAALVIAGLVAGLLAFSVAPATRSAAKMELGPAPAVEPPVQQVQQVRPIQAAPASAPVEPQLALRKSAPELLPARQTASGEKGKALPALGGSTKPVASKKLLEQVEQVDKKPARKQAPKGFSASKASESDSALEEAKAREAAGAKGELQRKPGEP